MADKPTGAKRTKNAVQFATQLDPDLAERFNARVASERRTKRAVLEAALRYYMDNVAEEASLSLPAPEQPKRGRPRKAKGE
jgi:hypothetical protein